ncbi:MAG: DUF1822 family protein [Brasilonema octagenarum HA4186-MV1]|jgi:hypothetical protein|nr:DUF1822 family protein [Brasilonema octagenarum HA4186-MV1]
MNISEKSILTTQKRRIIFSPKVVLLEPDFFEEAQVISEKNFNQFGEISQWKFYLNALAQLGFENYLKERNPNLKINQDSGENLIDDVCYLNIGEFRLCLIIIDNLIDDFVTVSQKIITSPKRVAHFYVLLEILEEEEQLNIHGFLRYDELVKYWQSINLEVKSNSYYQLPLSWFDSEINNLLLYSRFLSPTAIPLPSVVEVNNTEIRNITQATSISTQTLVNLTNWWLEVFEEGWQSTKNILKTLDNNYVWGYARSHSINEHYSGAKKLDFGLLLNGQTLALVVNLKRLENNEVDVLVQVIHCYQKHHNEEYLPPGLKLRVTLNPNTSESESEEVTAREADKVIQLEFSEALGKQFKVEVSFNNLVVTEDFLL